MTIAGTFLRRGVLEGNSITAATYYPQFLILPSCLYSPIRCAFVADPSLHQLRRQLQTSICYRLATYLYTTVIDGKRESATASIAVSSPLDFTRTTATDGNHHLSPVTTRRLQLPSTRCPFPSLTSIGSPLQSPASIKTL